MFNSDLAVGFLFGITYLLPIVVAVLAVVSVCLLVSINRKVKKTNELVSQLACKSDATGTEHE